jgi:hypothetical protein
MTHVAVAHGRERLEALSLLGAALLLSAMVIVFRATGAGTTDGTAA